MENVDGLCNIILLFDFHALSLKFYLLTLLPIPKLT